LTRTGKRVNPDWQLGREEERKETKFHRRERLCGEKSRGKGIQKNLGIVQGEGFDLDSGRGKGGPMPRKVKRVTPR